MMIKCSVAWDGLPNGMEGEQEEYIYVVKYAGTYKEPLL